MNPTLIPLLFALAFGVIIGIGLSKKYSIKQGGYQPKDTGLCGTPPSDE